MLVRTSRTSRRLNGKVVHATYLQRALKCFGQLDQAFDHKIAELDRSIMSLLLQLLWRAPQQHHQGQEGVGPAQWYHVYNTFAQAWRSISEQAGTHKQSRLFKQDMYCSTDSSA